jgi:6,7-dimethyl-8-ribityllumazine synthase
MATALKNLSDYQPENIPNAKPYRFGIVVSEWNPEVTLALNSGCHDTLVKHGALAENIHTVFVPGSFDLPLAAQFLLENDTCDAVICLGCVIQGETRHFEFINQAVAAGIKDVYLTFSQPVIFGVLTTDNQQQALDRAGGKHGNKGVEAAIAAIKMTALQHSIINSKS